MLLFTEDLPIGVIGTHFFRNQAENAVTVNVLRYRDMLTNFFWPIIDDMDVTFLILFRVFLFILFLIIQQ